MMEIYSEKMELLQNPDMEKGRLKEGTRKVRHEAIEAVEEKWHYETVREYKGGGRDIRRVIDVPGRAARAAWEEEVPIRIYVPYTQAELEEIEAQKNKPTLDERVRRLEEIVRRMMERGKDNGEKDGEDDQLALHDTQPVSQ